MSAGIACPPLQQGYCSCSSKTGSATGRQIERVPERLDWSGGAVVLSRIAFGRGCVKTLVCSILCEKSGADMASFIEGVDREQIALFPDRLEEWVGDDKSCSCR